MSLLSSLLLLGSLILTAPLADAATPASTWIYVGTYTGGKGIYGVSLDMATGKLAAPKLIYEIGGPAFLAFDAPRNKLYAVVDSTGGAVAQLTANASTHALSGLVKTASGGSGSTHLSVTKDGRVVLTANYNAGTAAMLPISYSVLGAPLVTAKHTGSGPTSRQKSPHPHGVYVDPTGKFALACDLGTDKIYIYNLDSGNNRKFTLKGTFTLPPGSGPRHLCFSPDGKFAYVVNELTSTVAVLKWDSAKGTLTNVQLVKLLPEAFEGDRRACEVAVHPNGNFLYATDRGPDAISCFKIDRATGKLTLANTTPTGGLEARHFAIDSTGNYLISANMNSNQVIAFKINIATGELTKKSEVTIAKPSCICFIK